MQGHERAEVGAATRSVNAGSRTGIRPREFSDRERYPRGGIHLDDVCGSTASVAWSLDALHGAEGRYAHLDGMAGMSLGEDL